MPSQVYTLADESEPAVTQEEPAAAPAEEKASEPEPAAEAPQASEPAAEEPAAGEPAQAEEPSGGGKADADKPSDETASEDGQTEEPAVVEEPEEVVEEEPQEVSYPKQNFEGTTGDVDVMVFAPEGELPEGTTMKVKNVANWRVNGPVKDEMGDNVKVIKAVDITFYDADGNEIEPKGEKALSVSFVSEKFADNDDLSVVHIDDSKNVEKVSDDVVENKGEEVAFEAGEFSVYAVVATGGDARLKVNFVQGDGEVVSVFVKSDDYNDTAAQKITTVLYDPGAGSIGNLAFYGWTEDEDYTSESEMLTIEQIRTAVKAKLDSGITDGEEVTYYAAVFKAIVATYMDKNNVVLHSDTTLIKTSEEETEYTIDYDYAVTSTDQEFQGWFVSPAENATLENGDPVSSTTTYENGMKCTPKSRV